MLESLFKGKTLSRAEAKEVMRGIATAEYSQTHVVSFLSVLRTRSVTVDELKGFRDALLELASKIDLSEYNAIDLCGTGGDGKGSFNVSTIASFVVAGAGQKVAKHGNYSASSSMGSSNLLEALGIRLTNDESLLRKNLEESNLCFLHAPLFHPALKNVASIRKEMGVRTVFNLLGPLVNPSSPRAQLIGVYGFEIMRLYDYVLKDTDIQYGIVHSFDGYDEVSLTGPAKIATRDGEVVLEPDAFGVQGVTSKDLEGSLNKEDAVKLCHSILSGSGDKAKTDVVIANSALALQIANRKPLLECMELASRSLKSGDALRVLSRLVG